MRLNEGHQNKQACSLPSLPTTSVIPTPLCATAFANIYIVPKIRAQLRASGQRTHAGVSAGKGNFGGPPPGEAGQHDASALVPLGQLLSGHRVGVLTSIQASDERRGACGSAANVERPADESTVLVGVEDNVGGGGEGDAVLSNLSFRQPCPRNNMGKQSTYGHIAAKKGAAIGNAERDGVGDVRAPRVTAEMTVADGRITAGVKVCEASAMLCVGVSLFGHTNVWIPALEFGDKVNRGVVHTGADALRRNSGSASEACEKGLE
jgi:hypothetical protein